MSSRVVQTLAFYLSFVVVGLASASFGPGIPSFASRTGAAVAGVGVLFVFQRIGYISGSLGIGRLFDRQSPVLLIGLALLAIGAAMVVLPLAGRVEIVWVIILLIGLAQGSTEVGANIGVVRLWGDGAGPVMNGLHLVYGVGAIISPLVLMVSLQYFAGITVGYWVLAGMTLAAAVYVLSMPRTKGVAAEQSHTQGGGSPLLVGLMALMLFATIAGEASIGGWIYSYALAAEIGGTGTAGFLNSGFWAALTLGRLAGIDLVRRLGVRRLILVNTIGAAAAATLFLAAPRSATVVTTAVLLLGFAQASIAPAAFTFAGQLSLLSGRMAGLLVAGASAGAMTLPWLVGRLFESVGPISFVQLLWVSQIAALVAFVVLLVVLARQRKSGTGERAT